MTICKLETVKFDDFNVLVFFWNKQCSFDLIRTLYVAVTSVFVFSLFHQRAIATDEGVFD